MIEEAKVKLYKEMEETDTIQSRLIGKNMIDKLSAEETAGAIISGEKSIVDFMKKLTETARSIYNAHDEKPEKIAEKIFGQYTRNTAPYLTEENIGIIGEHIKSRSSERVVILGKEEHIKRSGYDCVVISDDLVLRLLSAYMGEAPENKPKKRFSRISLD